MVMKWLMVAALIAPTDGPGMRLRRVPHLSSPLTLLPDGAASVATAAPRLPGDATVTLAAVK